MKCRSKVRGSVLVLTLVLVTLMTALTLTSLGRTNHQSQLVAGLARQTLLETEAMRALAAAARNIGEDGHTRVFTPGCPEHCDWGNARSAHAAEGVAAAYLVQRLAPSTSRFLITARAVRANGSSAIVHALFDADPTLSGSWSEGLRG